MEERNRPKIIRKTSKRCWELKKIHPKYVLNFHRSSKTFKKENQRRVQMSSK